MHLEAVRVPLGGVDAAQPPSVGPFPWEALGEAAPRLTQHGAWLRACVETLAPEADLRFLTVGPAEQPRALAPLVRQGGLGRVGFLGVEEFNEPTDLLAQDDEARAALCALLAERHVPLALNRLPAESPTIAAVQHAYRKRATVVVRPYRGSPRILLDASWGEAEGKLNARRRSDQRRARRRAETLGPVSVEILAPTPETLDGALAEALDVEMRSWKAHVGAAILQDAARGPTLRRFAELAAEAGLLRLALLRVGETAIAMQFGCVHGDAYWLLKVAYDESFKRCSPGQLLAAATIGAAADRGLARYEFLGSPEPWTALWANAEQACVSLRTFPWRPAGLTLLAGDALRALKDRVRQRVRRTGADEDSA